MPKFMIPMLILVILAGMVTPAGGGSYNPRRDLLSTGDHLLSGIIEDAGDPEFWFGDIYTYSDIYTFNVDPDLQCLTLNHAVGPGSLLGGVSHGESGLEGDGQSWWELAFGYGYGMADLNIGLLLKYRELRSDAPVPAPHAEKTTIGLGVDLHPHEKWNLDLALEYWRLQFHDPVTGGGASGVCFRARGFHSWRDLVTLVPLVEYFREERSEIDAASAENIGLGLGFDYQPADPLHLFLGLGGRRLFLEFAFSPLDTLSDGSRPTDRRDRYTCLPAVMLGVEYDLRGLMLRLGAGRSWLTVAGDATAEVEPDHWNLEFGVGLALDRFQVDLALNPDWLYDFGHRQGGGTRRPPVTMDLRPEIGASPFPVPAPAGDAPVIALQVKYYR